ncbi:MAG TPA: site-2 protease family protein [Lapillicoccus sp.]|nr:site-2 protease family protein [Lapillicoccus sp.]
MTAGPGRSAPYGWRLGAIRGIPVYLGRSWPIIAIIVVLTFGPSVPAPTGGSGGAFGYAVAVAYAVLLLISVLAHEAGHALVARRFGYRVDRVVADLWGGHTIYDSSTSRPGASALISVCGPLANLALAAVGYAAEAVAPGGVVGLLLVALYLTNAFVGIFNLLPGLPLDGGYIVHALVWKVTGDRNRALIVAGWLGRVITVVVILWLIGRPFLAGLAPSLWTIVWCGLIGAFLWVGATNAIRTGQSRRSIERVPLSQVLRPAVVVGVTDSVAAVLAVVDRAASGARVDGPVRGPGSILRPDAPAGYVAPVVVVVGRAGEALGIADLDAARAIDPARQGQVTVEAVVGRQPNGWVVVVGSADGDVSGLVNAVAAGGSAAPQTLLAVTPAGQVLGTVTLADLSAAFSR